MTHKGWTNETTYLAWVYLSNDESLYATMQNATGAKELSELFPQWDGANWDEIFEESR